VLYAGKPSDDCDCGVSCHEETPIDVYLKHISALCNIESPKYNPNLLGLYINPKFIPNLTPEARRSAGRNVFNLINQYMYEYGNPKIHCYLINSIAVIEAEAYVRGYEEAENELK